MTKNKTLSTGNPPPVWLIPETAPKDGTPFLGDFGWPVALMTVWDEYDEQWVYSMPQSCPMEDGPNNHYFDMESERGGLRAWMPLPKLPERKRGK